MPIHLYIEHLLNIRTLSIQASLPTSSTQTTRASISADKAILTLTHNDETASIKLPINLSPNKESKISLDIPPVPQKELSFRVQLEEKEGSELTAGLSREDGVVTPWTADQLTAETEICCRACASVIVERGKIQQWKDLPSEGWAEMMDFWHCHKPDHPDGPHAHEADGESKKGYAAGSKLALESGVGMVDALNFVFVAEDCSSLTTRENADANDLLCSNNSCAALIGTIDTETQGHKLHKPSLSLSTQPPNPHASFKPSKWLSLQILTAVESQGIRKFTVQTPTLPNPDPDPDPAQKQKQKQKRIKIWVFTPDLLVSTSALETNEPVRVAKIMWKQEDAPPTKEDDLAGKLSRQALSEGELPMREEEAEVLVRVLRGSGEWLPKGSREFAGWRVGLLERFERGDLEGP